jgi:diguanylate cyclase (GGDEF)-like protein
VDLDGFKRINDSLGHTIGDKLLISVGNRLARCVRISDTVSRQGGDEFVVLLTEMSEPADAGITARRFLQALSEPHPIDGYDLQVNASIGISVYPDDGLDAAALIEAADTAMYKVKATGRHGYQFFEAAMEAGAVERQYIEESIRRGIERGEFALHYQPKINIRSGAITGAEALIRWTHPVRGAIAPASFIPVAENSGLICTLGSWALREACQQGRRWAEAGLPPITLAVNVSPIELGKGGFLDGVLGIFRETGFDPRYIELEVTEGVLMKRAASTDAMLKSLKETGLRLAIDDFGTGYSSLSYLTKFPIDTIKIDQSFVRQISTDPTETAIVTAIISMAHSLNLIVVAEGVETREEFDFLSNLGCDEAQGYYFSRPVTAASFTPLLFNSASSQRLGAYQ